MTRFSVIDELKNGLLIEVKLLESSPSTLNSYMIINRKRLNSITITNLLDCNFL
ncbi:hypothetical protein [Clostridium argentinense]|uniref:hypothetical protein n=1 Tax=Clostridium argentinense TaxID=29341 RepID=UPI00163F9237|nr:hypothetical protein [Clostridium argentinense]